MTSTTSATSTRAPRRRRAAVLLASLLLVAAAASARPPVFQDLGFDDATKLAAEKDLLLILDATAVWCPPCKKMDQTTWIDERVAKWLAEHAVTLQFDVDRQRELAARFNIKGMPTVIALRNGKEFDRVAGYHSAEQLLAWLGGLVEGRLASETFPDPTGGRAGADGRVDLRARLDLARGLGRRGEFGAATEEYLWLWNHMLEHDRAFYALRVSSMVAEMRSLAAQSASALAAFRKRRDLDTPIVENDTANFLVLNDWLYLNHVIGEDEATLAWFDRVKGREGTQRVLDATERPLFDVLASHDRWADMGIVYRDAPATAQRSIDVHAQFCARLRPEHAEMRAAMDSLLVERLARLYAACLTAHREEDAKTMVDLALAQSGPKCYVTIVEMALRTKQPRAEQRGWLVTAREAGAPVGDVATRLDQALAEGGT